MLFIFNIILYRTHVVLNLEFCMKRFLFIIFSLVSMNVFAQHDKKEFSYTQNKSNLVFTVKGVSFTMIAVEDDTFWMGAISESFNEPWTNSKPIHKVTLSDFYIGETEVTQDLWVAVMGTNPSRYIGSRKPVENVSWDDCQEFIDKLNQLTGKKFKLPSEAEWEFAARGGIKSKEYRYSGSDTLDCVAWYSDNSESQTHNVMTKVANELGIYDMTGNVWEWCHDWFGSYKNGWLNNPQGPDRGQFRVIRGSCWLSKGKCCHVSNRSFKKPNNEYKFIGLRLCLED